MLISIAQTCKDFFLFLRRPVDQPDVHQTNHHKIERFLCLLVIQISAIVILGIAIYVLETLGLVSIDGHKLKMLSQQLPLCQFTFVVVILGPFVEESVFRFYLRFKNNPLIHSIVILASVTGKENKRKMELYLRDLWTNKFPNLFFFSAIAFAYLHLLNYKLTSTTFLLSPILVAPQFVAGLFLGYLRIRYNFLLAYCMHAAVNTLIIIANALLV